MMRAFSFVLSGFSRAFPGPPAPASSAALATALQTVAVLDRSAQWLADFLSARKRARQDSNRRPSVP
jgi:hypothetical protein